MNKYWSNEDDEKVTYITEQPLRDPRAADSRRAASEGAGAQPPQSDAFAYSRKLSPHPPEAGTPERRAARPNAGADRSSFISEELNTRTRRAKEYAPPAGDRRPGENFAYSDGYQVHSEHPRGAGGGRRGNFWLKFLVVILALTVIAGGAYFFRYEILDLIGKVFGEEVVWKIAPTPVPTEAVMETHAYVGTAKMEAKPKSMQEIGAVTGGLDLETDAVTEQNIVMANENQDGTYDYYLFAYDTGRLLGYYEGLRGFMPCGKNIFYAAGDPYLITSRGFPLADMEALRRSAGSDVVMHPMINGWAMVSDAGGEALNFVGEDGALISDLWFSKAFPFTGDTTLAYVDTGNVTEGNARYALYLLRQSGETKRLHYVADTSGVMDSVCGMAFAKNGEMRLQDDALTLVTVTDDAAAYVNCGALVVRDPGTGLYGLFVGGVQQYPFAFDSIEPVPSDLGWTAEQTGYVTRYAFESREYPLPRSYNFILKRGDTQQIISLAAVSVYPIVFD